MSMSLNEPNARLVEMIERALISAKRGEIQSGGVIGVSALGQYMQAACGSAEQVYFGCDSLKDFLKAQVLSMQGQKQPPLGEER